MRLLHCCWKTISVLLAIAVFVGCAESNKEQASCGFVQNVYGERISWKNQIPIPLQIHSSVPRDMIPAIENALQTWEQAAGRALFRIQNYSYTGEVVPRQDGLNVISFLNSWESNKASEQARTSIYWVGSEIREADIRINAKNFTFYTDVPVRSQDVHLESLVLHELGHLLGLKHTDQGGQVSTQSVMATYLAAQTKRDILPEADIAAVQCEY